MNETTSKKSLAVAILLIVILSGLFFVNSGKILSMEIKEIRSYIDSFGMWGPLVYMIMFSVIPSGAVIAIAGGMTFGFYYGSVYTLIGAVIGSCVAFFISRALGRDALEKRLSNKLKGVDEQIQQGGFLMVLILRLIPIVPFNLVSYGAGLANIKFIDYFSATLIGIIPGVLIFTSFGDKALDVSSPQFIMTSVILAAMILASIFVKRNYSIGDLKKAILGKKDREQQENCN